MGEKLTDEQVDEMLATMEPNGDGHVRFDGKLSKGSHQNPTTGSTNLKLKLATSGY